MAAGRHCSGVEEGGQIISCTFNARTAGKAAAGKFQGKCLWCSPEGLREACGTARERRVAARALASLGKLSEEVFAAARARVQAFDGGQEVTRLADAIRREVEGQPAQRELICQDEEDAFKNLAGWFEKPSLLAAAKKVLLASRYPPQEWGPILILKRKYWDWIVSGEKTIEIRGRALRPMPRHVGHSGQIWGVVTLGKSVRIRETDTWKMLTPFHRWDVDVLPYKKTYAHPIFKIEVFDFPVAYLPIGGQIGNAKYRPAPENREAVGRSAAGVADPPRAQKFPGSKSKCAGAGRGSMERANETRAILEGRYEADYQEYRESMPASVSVGKSEGDLRAQFMDDSAGRIAKEATLRPPFEAALQLPDESDSQPGSDSEARDATDLDNAIRNWDTQSFRMAEKTVKERVP